MSESAQVTVSGARRVGMWKTLLVATLVSCGVIAAQAPAAIAAPPVNDHFANATVLAPTTSVTITGSNVEATTQAGESLCCWFYNSVWYKWTAPQAGTYRLEICASSFDTSARVATGSAVNTMTLVAENYDDPGCGPDSKRSRLTFTAAAGQEYKFQIGSQVDNQTGTITGSLTFVPPPVVDPPVTPTPTPAPANTAAPAIGGTVRVGRRVTCSQGTWLYAPTSYSFQWLRNGVPTRVLAATYYLTATDAGKRLTCAVRATNASGQTQAQSAAVRVPGVSAGNDVLTGTSLPETVDMLAGNDTFRAGGGKDIARGGRGNDLLYGQLGADRLFGDAGADLLDGGPGNDALTGGPGKDRFVAGAGADAVSARDGLGGERISCGRGFDTAIVDRGDLVAADCERVRRS